MMKKKDRDAWVAALRSGKYEQGKRMLCCGGKYCCLGVAYDVLVGEWVDGDGWKRTQGNLAHVWDPPGCDAGDQLWSMNDRGVPFTEIADWIEENVPAC